MRAKKHWEWIIVLTLVVAVAACGPPERKKRDDTAPDEPQAMVPQTPEEPPFNIGDVEQKCINVEANLAPQSVSSAIVVARLEDRMDILKILTIDVSPPYPEELWLTYRVNSEKDLADNPVALRAKVLADDREIGSFSLVLAEGAKENTFEKQVNILEGLDATPESIGVRVAPVAALFPEGTDAATIDPETAQTDEMSEAIYCTFVRVNFLPEAEAASSEDGA